MALYHAIYSPLNNVLCSYALCNVRSFVFDHVPPVPSFFVKANGEWVSAVSVDIVVPNPSPPSIGTHSVSITNHGAESGVSGWVSEVGSIQTYAISPPSAEFGSFCFFAGSTPSLLARQRVSLFDFPQCFSSIDSGASSFSLAWFQASWDSSNDPGGMGVRFLNSTLSVLSESRAPSIPATSLPSWSPRSLFVPVPPYCRYVDILIFATRTMGTDCDMYVDNISASVHST